MAVAHAQPFAFVANDISRNVTAVAIDPAEQNIAGSEMNDPRVIATAERKWASVKLTLSP